jgi:outer membrane protein/protease secretion system outer membrane protein
MKYSMQVQGPTGRRARGLTLRALAAAAALFAGSAWSMDLLQAYQAALQEDATVRAARAASDAARERLPQARAQLLPNIAFSAVRNRNDLSRTQENPLSGQPVTTDEQHYSFNQTLQLRQPLFRKPLWAGLEQAGYIVQDADASFERELQNLGVRVAGSYLEALLAHDQLELVLSQQAFTLTQLDAAHKALAAGSGTRTDIDEAQARLDLNRAQELEARQHLDYTRRQLEVLTRHPVGQIARLYAGKLPLLQPEQQNLDAWLAKAEASSPELRALKARLEAARSEVTKAQGGHYPTLDAVAQITRSASENVTTPSSRYSNRALGLQLNVPLYAGGYTSSIVRQAVAEQTRAEEMLEATRRDLGLRLHREYRGVTEGVAKVGALEQAVRSAEQLVKSTRRSFEAGSRTLVDILNAEQQLQSTRRDLAQARYLYLISRVRLQALAGGDKEAVITELNGWLAGG